MWERTDEDQQSDGDLEEQSGTLQPWHLWRAKLHATLTQKGRRDDPGPSKTVNIFVLCFSSLFLVFSSLQPRPPLCSPPLLLADIVITGYQWTNQDVDVVEKPADPDAALNSHGAKAARRHHVQISFWISKPGNAGSLSKPWILFEFFKNPWI